MIEMAFAKDHKFRQTFQFDCFDEPFASAIQI